MLCMVVSSSFYSVFNHNEWVIQIDGIENEEVNLHRNSNEIKNISIRHSLWSVCVQSNKEKNDDDDQKQNQSKSTSHLYRTFLTRITKCWAFYRVLHIAKSLELFRNKFTFRFFFILLLFAEDCLFTKFYLAAVNFYWLPRNFTFWFD